MNIQFSYFVGGSKIVTPTNVYNFKDVINLYNSDVIKNLTSKLISCTDPREKMILKNQQPFVTPYGTFSYRENKSILNHNSNLVAFDFDKMEQFKAKELKAVLSNNKSCMLATISGSQKGVKAFFLINDTIPLNKHYDTLKLNANNLLATIGISEYLDYLDTRQFVLSQAMFISHDAEIYYNFQAEPLEIKLEIYKEPEQKKIETIKPVWQTDVNNKKINSVIKYVQKATENLCDFYNNHTGARHDTIAKVKNIAGIIKAYNLPIESEVYNVLECSIVAMYGGNVEAKISNAYKSLNHAWENAEAIQNETINFIFERKYNNSYEVKYIAPPEPSFHDYNLVSQSGRNFKENNFIQFLKTLFTTDEIQNVIMKYLIGTSKHWSGATVFWQIDNNEKVRHGKVMLFNPETGKRKKKQDGKSYISSVRSVLNLQNFNINQCLFGLHLINESNQTTIAVVESEKTAVLMSVFKPQYIWVATGMKGGFKYENLKPIKDYKIIAFPDKSEYNDWHDKAVQLNAVGFNIIVSDWLEETDYNDGTDLADVYIDELSNIEPNQIREFTATEIMVNKIAEHTPEIRLLIETFDLTDNNGNEIINSK